MKARSLLRLYPVSWRERYGEELEDLLGDRPLTVSLALDLLRGGLDAHLHPELVQPALATAGGGIHFMPRSPRTRVLGALLVALTGLLGWGLALPNPVLPIFLPIGAHSSAEALAQAKAPALPIRATVQRGGLAAVFLASGPAAALVVASRAPTHGWMDVGGGMSLGAAAPNGEHPISVGLTAGANMSVTWIAISGTALPEVARIELLFTDGSRETLAVRDGAFLWFDASSTVLPLLPRVPGISDLDQQSAAFGRLPSTVIARSSSDTELARVQLRPSK